MPTMSRALFPPPPHRHFVLRPNKGLLLQPQCAHACMCAYNSAIHLLVMSEGQLARRIACLPRIGREAKAFCFWKARSCSHGRPCHGNPLLIKSAPFVVNGNFSPYYRPHYPPNAQSGVGSAHVLMLFASLMGCQRMRRGRLEMRAGVCALASRRRCA